MKRTYRIRYMLRVIPGIWSICLHAKDMEIETPHVLIGQEIVNAALAKADPVVEGWVKDAAIKPGFYVTATLKK